MQPGGGWILSSGAGERGWVPACMWPPAGFGAGLFPVHGRVFCTEACSGTLIPVPHLHLLGSKSMLSASSPTSKSKIDSQLVCYSCLDYSLQAGWDDLMDLIRKSWLCAIFMLLFGFPLQPCTGRSACGGAGGGGARTRGPGSRPVLLSCLGNLCPVPAQGSQGSQKLLEGFV